MSCITGIAKHITSTCESSIGGGIEVLAWIFDRTKLAPTYDATITNLITDLSVVGGTGYKLTGVKKLLNAGHDVVVADDRPDKYKHFVSFQGFEILAEDIQNIDDINDVAIFFELKDKNDTGDGIFVGYGVKKGLWKSTDTRRWNDINGARNIEMASLDAQEEPVSHWVLLNADYATTLALLNSLVAA